jgi:DNA-binding transcriptional regulator GbsR (MarR family)
MRGERKKYYQAESDMWQMIRNVLGSRERREVDLALHVLGESIEKLQGAEAELTPEEKELAQYYLERIADLQSFFQFAQIALETVLGSQESLDFEAITKIEIR